MTTDAANHRIRLDAAVLGRQAAELAATATRLRGAALPLPSVGALGLLAGPLVIPATVALATSARDLLGTAAELATRAAAATGTVAADLDALEEQAVRQMRRVQS